MNPYREASNILDKAKKDCLVDNPAPCQFLERASFYCWKIARDLEQQEFDSLFREVTA